MDSIGNKNKKDKEKLRKPIIKELQKLIKRFGRTEVKYTFSWWNQREAARITRENKIKKLQEEIGDIKGGKMPYGY